MRQFSASKKASCHSQRGFHLVSPKPLLFIYTIPIILNVTRFLGLKGLACLLGVIKCWDEKKKAHFYAPTRKYLYFGLTIPAILSRELNKMLISDENVLKNEEGMHFNLELASQRKGAELFQYFLRPEKV